MSVDLRGCRPGRGGQFRGHDFGAGLGQFVEGPQDVR